MEMAAEVCEMVRASRIVRGRTRHSLYMKIGGEGLSFFAFLLMMMADSSSDLRVTMDEKLARPGPWTTRTRTSDDQLPLLI
jgi:hypothetical protein